MNEKQQAVIQYLAAYSTFHSAAESFIGDYSLTGVTAKAAYAEVELLDEKAFEALKKNDGKVTDESREVLNQLGQKLGLKKLSAELLAAGIIARHE